MGQTVSPSSINVVDVQIVRASNLCRAATVNYRIDPKWLRSEPSGQTLRDVSARLENPGPIDVHLSLEKQKTFTCNTNRAGAYYKLLGFCFSSQLV
jgi:hypothetical protein